MSETTEPSKRTSYKLWLIPSISISLIGVLYLCAAHLKQDGLSVLDAILLGVVEGVTEYLPISSTGHLLFIQELLGLTNTQEAKSAADSYAIIIQFGAILAVAGLYRQHIWHMLLGLLGQNPAGLKIALNLALAFTPAAIIGLTLHSYIKHYLFGPWPIVTAWAIGGILLLKWRRGKQTDEALMSLEKITYRQALMIGFFQCIAVWPGMSRSLATIVGGVVVGLPLVAAVEFSFLLGGLTLTAASCYELMTDGAAMFKIYNPQIVILGVVVSLISAVISIKWLVTYLKTKDMAVFGYYRIVIALLATAYLIVSHSSV